MKPPILPIQLASIAEMRHKALYRVNLSKGETQCPYRHPHGDARIACVLKAGIQALTVMATTPRRPSTAGRLASP